MKRWYAILMIVGLLFSLCACTQEEGSAQSPPSVQSAQQQQEQQTADTETTQQEQQTADTETTQQPEAAQGTPVVYMTREITPEGLMAVYQALQWEPQGRVAVKLSTGEPPASNYLRPELIAGLVQSLDGTIVECNTAYGGSRAETAMHYQVAEDHGFTAIADFQILDEEGSMTLPVQGGTRLSENYVGAAFDDYDSYLVLSHFKGHSMAGYGGAIKNISIGLGSSEGKAWIHSAGSSRTNPWGGDQDAFLESMAEAGKSVSDYLGDQIVYINVMNRLSVDCDCDGNPAEPDMHDIGILASTDPVALDQACIDLGTAPRTGSRLSTASRAATACTPWSTRSRSALAAAAMSWSPSTAKLGGAPWRRFFIGNLFICGTISPCSWGRFFLTGCWAWCWARPSRSLQKAPFMPCLDACRQSGSARWG